MALNGHLSRTSDLVAPIAKGSKQGSRNVSVPQGSQAGVLPNLFASVCFEKYIVVKSVDDRSINDLDFFKYTMVKVCGREPKALPQGDGSLLVEVFSPEESLLLRTLTSVSGAEVSCFPHVAMN